MTWDIPLYFFKPVMAQGCALPFLCPSGSASLLSFFLGIYGFKSTRKIYKGRRMSTQLTNLQKALIWARAQLSNCCFTVRASLVSGRGNKNEFETLNAFPFSFSHFVFLLLLQPVEYYFVFRYTSASHPKYCTGRFSGDTHGFKSARIFLHGLITPRSFRNPRPTQ